VFSIKSSALAIPLPQRKQNPTLSRREATQFSNFASIAEGMGSSGTQFPLIESFPRLSAWLPASSPCRSLAAQCSRPTRGN
jgi:hypothetical protein